MRFLIDENVPRRFALALRELGHDVALVSPGESNSAVLERCLKGQRILVTMDRDFIFHVPKDARRAKRIVIIAPSGEWLSAVSFLLKKLSVIERALELTNLVVIRHKTMRVEIPEGMVLEFE